MVRTNGQNFRHYNNLITQTQAKLTKATVASEKRMLNARILDKMEKQIKFAPTPEEAQKLTNALNFQKEINSLESQYLLLAKEADSILRKSKKNLRNDQTFRGPPNPAGTAARNKALGLLSWLRAGKSDTPDLKLMQEFKDSLKEFEKTLA